VYDAYSRCIDYLRVSVTAQCNLRCFYCRPRQAGEHTGDALSIESLLRVVRVMADLGLSRVRLTGGEPLLRPNILDFVAGLRGISAIKDVSVTTNGLLLKEAAPRLVKAGLHRVNISLDSLQPERYRKATQGGSLRQVLEGVEAALSHGLHPVKINVVVARGFNDGELSALADLSRRWPVHVRFIELMPIGCSRAWAEQGLVPVEEMRRHLEATHGPLVPLAKGPEGGGPARYFVYPGALGSLGFVAALSECFCARCNRLRLTADGLLRPCLVHEDGVDLLPVLGHPNDQALRDAIGSALAAKPGGHCLGGQSSEALTWMNRIGG
jgi:cyclic pyranopterin phosphate synthase